MAVFFGVFTQSFLPVTVLELGITSFNLIGTMKNLPLNTVTFWSIRWFQDMSLRKHNSDYWRNEIVNEKGSSQEPLALAGQTNSRRTVLDSCAIRRNESLAGKKVKFLEKFAGLHACNIFWTSFPPYLSVWKVFFLIFPNHAPIISNT